MERDKIDLHDPSIQEIMGSNSLKCYGHIIYNHGLITYDLCLMTEWIETIRWTLSSSSITAPGRLNYYHMTCWYRLLILQPTVQPVAQGLVLYRAALTPAGSRVRLTAGTRSHQHMCMSVVFKCLLNLRVEINTWSQIFVELVFNFIYQLLITS